MRCSSPLLNCSGPARLRSENRIVIHSQHRTPATKPALSLAGRDFGGVAADEVLESALELLGSGAAREVLPDRLQVLLGGGVGVSKADPSRIGLLEGCVAHAGI